MKNLSLGLIYCLVGGFILVVSCSKNANRAATNTSIANSVAGTNTSTIDDYESDHPYNLNVVLFVPKDVNIPIDYQKRLSEIMLSAQSFYKTNMNNNGFVEKTFGLLKLKTNNSLIKIDIVTGKYNLDDYRTTGTQGNAAIGTEVKSFYVANPTQKSSEHVLVITETADKGHGNLPFYGSNPYCYAFDYTGFDIKNVGVPTSDANYYGGLFHELGHGLTLPHNCQTKTEYTNSGTNLMSTGNQTYGFSKTFLNMACCAILNNCQVFAATTGGTYYNNYTTSVQTLSGFVSNSGLTIYGSFLASEQVTAVNVFQNNHDADPQDQNYYGTVWSVIPSGKNFTVNMPTNELAKTVNGNYRLGIQLVLGNGRVKTALYSFTFSNSQPVVPQSGFNQVKNGIYQLATAVNSASLVNVSDPAFNNALVSLAGASSATSSQWQLVVQADNTFKLHPLNATGLSLDETGVTSNGTQVQVRTDTSLVQQNWALTPMPDGNYKLQSANMPAGTIRNLNLKNSSTTAGTAIQVSDDANTAPTLVAHEWCLLPISN